MTPLQVRELKVIVWMLLVFGAILWWQHHEADIAEKAAAAEKINEKQDDVDKQRENLRLQQQQLQDALAALEAQRRNVQTPAQVIRELPQYLPQNLPQPITVNIPTPTKENPTPAPTGVTIPAADLKPLFDQQVQCKECTAKLTAAENAALATGQIIKDKDQIIKAQSIELKGGTFWKRTKRAAKWMAIGGAVGTVAICGTGHCQ